MVGIWEVIVILDNSVVAFLGKKVRVGGSKVWVKKFFKGNILGKFLLVKLMIGKFDLIKVVKGKSWLGKISGKFVIRNFGVGKLISLCKLGWGKFGSCK